MFTCDDFVICGSSYECFGPSSLQGGAESDSDRETWSWEEVAHSFLKRRMTHRRYNLGLKPFIFAPTASLVCYSESARLQLNFAQMLCSGRLRGDGVSMWMEIRRWACLDHLCEGVHACVWVCVCMCACEQSFCGCVWRMNRQLQQKVWTSPNPWKEKKKKKTMANLQKAAGKGQLDPRCVRSHPEKKKKEY